MLEEEYQDRDETVFRAYVQNLKTVTSFRYLGRILAKTDWHVPQKKCDNLLVEADKFYHFRGLICVMQNTLNLIHIKNKIVVAQFSKYSIQPRRTLKKLMDFLVPFVSHKCFSHCDGSIFIFGGWCIKINFYKN